VTPSATPERQPTGPASTDIDLVRRIADRDEAAFEILMRRYNGRLFRVARAILKDDADAEDVVQEAYLDAYRHIGAFRGDASVATWLTRIAVNQALMRLRGRRRDGVVVPFIRHGDQTLEGEDMSMRAAADESPSEATLRAEVRQLLEKKIDALPAAYRAVFVLREVEELSVEETAAALSIPAATVRSRSFRARALLRAALARDVDLATTGVFGFAGDRCDRMVAAVLARLHELS
jgi:RNA polymerase sigma-70 factor (ECF subfamily)